MQWASAVSSSVFPQLVGYMQANAFPRGPDGMRDMDVIEKLLPQVERQIGLLDRAVAPSGHLAEDSFSVADMYLLPILAYLRIFPESAAMIATVPALPRYFETHAARPSVRATDPVN